MSLAVSRLGARASATRFSLDGWLTGVRVWRVTLVSVLVAWPLVAWRLLGSAPLVQMLRVVVSVVLAVGLRNLARRY